MRKTVFRVLAGILALLGIFAGILESRALAGSGYWPSWLPSLAVLAWSAFFLWFAVTGRPWSASFDRRVLGKNEDG